MGRPQAIVTVGVVQLLLNWRGRNPGRKLRQEVLPATYLPLVWIVQLGIAEGTCSEQQLKVDAQLLTVHPLKLLDSSIGAVLHISFGSHSCPITE